MSILTGLNEQFHSKKQQEEVRPEYVIVDLRHIVWGNLEGE